MVCCLDLFCGYILVCSKRSADKGGVLFHLWVCSEFYHSFIILVVVHHNYTKKVLSAHHYSEPIDSLWCSHFHIFISADTRFKDLVRCEKDKNELSSLATMQFKHKTQKKTCCVYCCPIKHTGLDHPSSSVSS